MYWILTVLDFWCFEIIYRVGSLLLTPPLKPVQNWLVLAQTTTGKQREQNLNPPSWPHRCYHATKLNIRTTQKPLYPSSHAVLSVSTESVTRVDIISQNSHISNSESVVTHMSVSETRQRKYTTVAKHA